MKIIISFIFGVLITLAILEQTKEECPCDKLREKQILTQLEIDLIHVKRVQQNWDRYNKK